ncbi:hypothetical protein [Pasteurella multocida]|uniref:hypothetical protein n=1 Tax=Pasteurella multocida TaxID=747 RepID=UPI0002828BD7|nr:hypothetical protein [Pasteurella multocida]ARB74181.1 hypothetical protein A6J55_08275 [Pasteurella multocida]EJZ77342.1 hypothetical protein X73_02040 [Pasteurella multocida subsp. gallicida X73]MCL7790006.1 hypothetical protein [Pasteurella multocida]MDY0578180.1 hypothetical protein [Pasteurella multocida]MDY0685750.1 hypothetical protein [Pasteurella multocida]
MNTDFLERLEYAVNMEEKNLMLDSNIFTELPSIEQLNAFIQKEKPTLSLNITVIKPLEHFSEGTIQGMSEIDVIYIEWEQN